MLSWAHIFKKGAKKLERTKQSPTENSKNGQGWRSMTHGNRMMLFSLIKRKLGRDIINSPVGERLLLQACWWTAFHVLKRKTQRLFFLVKKFRTFVLRFEDNFHVMKTYRRWLAQASFPPEKGRQNQHSPDAGATRASLAPRQWEEQ